MIFICDSDFYPIDRMNPNHIKEPPTPNQVHHHLKRSHIILYQCFPPLLSGQILTLACKRLVIR